MNSPSDLIRVAVVYAKADGQALREVRLERSSSVQAAIRASGLLEAFPEIDLGGANRVGVFARLASLDAPLRDGDRVEIYRQLVVDPKQARRARAVRARRK